MKSREWNIMMTAASVLGGLAGFAAGEVWLEYGEARVHETLLMGVYFGQLALWVGLACLLAETVSPRLNGARWRSRYCRDSWKLLIPASLVLLFAVGALFQFFYGLGGLKRAVPQDYALVLDRSGSMAQTDPDGRSLEAAKNLIHKMSADNRAAIVLFHDEPRLLLPMTALADEPARSRAADRLNEAGTPEHGTNIGSALELVSRHLDETGQPGRNSAVILISDGHSDVNLDRTLAPYLKQDVPVYTVGVQMDSDAGTRLLKRIANRTGARFYSVDRAEDITGVFSTILDNPDKRHLVGERTGPSAGSLLYLLLRIVLFAGIGAAMGLSLGIIFDNRHLAWRFAWGGTAAGLAAGALLELGLREAAEPALYRCAADVILALVMVLAPVAVPVPPESQHDQGQSGPEGPGWNPGRSFGLSKDRTTREFK